MARPSPIGPWNRSARSTGPKLPPPDENVAAKARPILSAVAVTGPRWTTAAAVTAASRPSARAVRTRRTPRMSRTSPSVIRGGSWASRPAPPRSSSPRAEDQRRPKSNPSRSPSWGSTWRRKPSASPPTTTRAPRSASTPKLASMVAGAKKPSAETRSPSISIRVPLRPPIRTATVSPGGVNFRAVSTARTAGSAPSVTAVNPCGPKAKPGMPAVRLASTDQPALSREDSKNQRGPPRVRDHPQPLN